MISANNITLRVGKKALFEDVNIKFTEGNCYGLIGANGAGKSTFLKILSGQLEPTNGDVVITPGQRLSFLQQDHFKYDAYTVLDTVIMGNKRLYEIMKEKDAIYAKADFTDEDGIRASELEGEFAEMNGWEAESDAATLLNGLGIETDLHYSQMADLTGSQKVKVLLAQALFGNPDILLLDEPTNHLDISSCEALENALLNYDGTLFVISHDRYLINKLADRIYYLTPDGVKEYRGSYDAYTLAAENAAQVRQEEKPAKQEKVNDYKLKKERDSERRKLNTKVTRAEAEIEELDSLIEQKTNELSGLTDYQKAMELSNEIEELRTRQEQAMQTWEEASLALEEFDK